MRKVKALLVGALVALVAFAGYNYITGDNTLAYNPSARDCNASSIINCGALSQSELAQKYSANATGDLGAIYDSYGINGSMITSGSAQEGYVTRDGQVVVNGKVVATGAMTLGRKLHSFSTPTTIGGKTYYVESPQASFVTDAIAAHVYFDSNGQFIGAILTSCGNPVRATPTPPAPKPAAACVSLALTPIDRTTFQVSSSGTAENGASLLQVFYNVTNESGQALPANMLTPATPQQPLVLLSPVTTKYELRW